MGAMLSRWAGLALLGAWMTAACLVKDFELTDLPAAGGEGDDEPAGGRPAAGSSGVDLEQGGASAGGEPAAGGSAVGGDPSGGRGGDETNAGNAGSGGAAPVVDLPANFPQDSACGKFNALLCDDFESGALDAGTWQPSDGPVIEMPAGPVPSGTHVMNNAYRKLTPNSSFPDAATLSFWVRFSADTDREFVTFQESPSVTITFGRESRLFRFRRHVVGQEPPVTAPTQAELTLGAPTDVWACIELRVAGDVQARVLTFADQLVDLPVLDSVETPGADEQWITAAGTGPSLGGLSFWFGDGNDAHYDDVLLTRDADGMSVCDHYLTPP